MSKLKEWANGFASAMENQTAFVAAVVIFIVFLFLLAIAAEKNYSKKNPDVSKPASTQRLVVTASMAALAAILMYFEVPLFFAPSFYKIDFSEIPVLICGFMLGPVSGALCEFVKIIIKLLIHPTSTAFVGEFANFVVGCAYVIPASIIYQRKKSRKTAVIAMVSGTLISTCLGMFTNAFILLPAFASMYGGIPVSALIDMGTAVNGAITNMFTFILLAVTPLNLIKFSAVSVIVFIIYKKISSLLKMKMK